jgi:hypothetical protein
MTQDELKQMMHYDPDTGIFTWRVKHKKAVPGKIAGCRKAGCRTRICIDRKLYYAGRLAWFYMKGQWPDPEVDHKDGDKSNDTWNNLREASRWQNGTNRKYFGKAGQQLPPGVSQNGKKFQAKIFHLGKETCLGTFPTALAAHERWLDECKAVGKYEFLPKEKIWI